ncbi:hypothetical protein HN858_02050 [Candidatus Falkowbacteria bacterium]|jgi:hypothetical protein|nr:hypothetical protein [Candidatus Falkowbacteria bacterium]MBT5503593.1 hypothetical protein [Candidatus Falkowbacteria bacterium]MBT6573993.1 hypothetical protein [Candidatus Falkowbacteria bacterium]MBT7348438.1 hypothetical protein [Candidatus Falkowbacteria bacterium]MBT7500608.1 hypothetical protein [Candidatus Falkowbacteria bacterium]
MTEEQWERVADVVAERLKNKEKFFDAVKYGLRDCGIRDYDDHASYYCKEMGRRLGKRKSSS